MQIIGLFITIQLEKNLEKKPTRNDLRPFLFSLVPVVHLALHLT